MKGREGNGVRPGATHTADEGVFFRVTDAVEEQFEEDASDVAAEEKGDEGRRAQLALQRQRVRVKEQGVVEEVAEV